MTETPEQPRLYGPDLAPELAAMLLRGENEACSARIEQLLAWWGSPNGVVQTLIFDLVRQYAATLQQLHHDNTEEAVEWAELTALDRGAEFNAIADMGEDLEWPFDEDGNPKPRNES